MLPFVTAHPEEHEAPVSAMAFAAPDPRRLDQPQTAGRHRVPPDGESSSLREARREANPAQRRPAPAAGRQRQDPRAENARASGQHRDSGDDSPVASRTCCTSPSLTTGPRNRRKSLILCSRFPKVFTTRRSAPRTPPRPREISSGVVKPADRRGSDGPCEIRPPSR